MTDPFTVFKPQALRNNSFLIVPDNESSRHSLANPSRHNQALNLLQATLSSHHTPQPLILENGIGGNCTYSLRVGRRMKPDKGCENLLNCITLSKPHAVAVKYQSWYSGLEHRHTLAKQKSGLQSQSTTPNPYQEQVCGERHKLHSVRLQSPRIRGTG